MTGLTKHTGHLVEAQPFTTEKPTGPGWYWWRQSTTDIPRPCWVYFAAGILYCHRVWSKYPDTMLSDHRGGEWSGPIPLPTDAPAQAYYKAEEVEALFEEICAILPYVSQCLTIGGSTAITAQHLLDRLRKGQG